MSGEVRPLAQDTSEDIERRQVEGWRRMSADEKAGIIAGLTQAVYDLALAGIRARYPEASPHEQSLRLAVVMLGPELARKAYPEVAALPVSDLDRALRDEGDR
jgi:hypothetical protein